MNLSTAGLDNIQFKNSLKAQCSQEQIVELISTKISTLPNFEALKYNPELVLFVSSCLEVSCAENGLQVDKQAMFLSIYKKVYEITTLDEVVIVHILEFLLTNKFVKLPRGKILEYIKKGLTKLLAQFISSV
jgi:hypothetical protein